MTDEDQFAFAYVECSIPEGQTIAAYRAKNIAPAPATLSRRGAGRGRRVPSGAQAMTRREYYANEAAGLGWMTVRVGFLLFICVLELFRRP